MGLKSTIGYEKQMSIDKGGIIERGDTPVNILQYRESEKWLNERMESYDNDKQEALFDMLVRTTEVIGQFVGSHESSATKRLLESCMEHNRLFINKVNLRIK